MLHYFHSDEFINGDRNWLRDCSPSLLVRLDVLRHMWGKPIRISAAPGAIGRMAGDSQSQHNFERWGIVRAIDVMPAGIGTPEAANGFYLLAVDVGFTGIGWYPDWKPAPGFHLDVRSDHEPGAPATWGGVKNDLGQQVYVSLNDALESFA